MAIPPVQSSVLVALAIYAKSAGQREQVPQSMNQPDDGVNPNAPAASIGPKDLSLGEVVASRACTVPLTFASSAISKEYERLERSDPRRKRSSEKRRTGKQPFPESDDNSSEDEIGHDH